MDRKDHGDRSAQPRPLSEVLNTRQLTEDDILSVREGEWQGQQPPFDPDLQVGIGYWEGEPTAETLDPDAPARMQAAAIAGGSYGAAGCFDDDMLIRRANVIFNYIKNGLR
jgi:hypothetical protein